MARWTLDNRILKLFRNQMDASTQTLAEKTAKLDAPLAEDDQSAGGIFEANLRRILDVTQDYFNLDAQYTGRAISDQGSRVEQCAETRAERKSEPEIGGVALRAARGYNSPPCYAHKIAPDYFGEGKDSQ